MPARTPASLSAAAFAILSLSRPSTKTGSSNNPLTTLTGGFAGGGCLGDVPPSLAGDHIAPWRNGVWRGSAFSWTPLQAPRAQNRSTDGSVFQKTGMLRAERAERCMLVLRSKCTHLSFMCRTALDLNSDEKVSVNPNLSDLLQQPTAHQCTARISPAVPRVGSEAACGATTLSQTVGQSVSSQPVSSQPASQSASQISQPVTKV